MKKLKNSHIVWIVIGSVVGCLLLIVSLVALFLGLLIFDEITRKQYATTDIADYGKYIGNYDDKRAEKMINLFFPPKIEEYFCDVQYSYKAKQGDACAFEAYLEFVIEDPLQYEAFVEEYTADLKGNIFLEDTSFTEYVYYDYFSSFVPIGEEDNPYCDYRNISSAEIGKILCCDEEQRIIFVAMQVYDGGMVDTQYLNVYFDRFEIKPKNYDRSRTPYGSISIGN